MIVKKWAAKLQINEAMHGTLNSTSLALMTIHYLQQAEVLPCLHQDFPELKEQIENRPVIEKPKWTMANETPTTDMVMGWFAY